jgi:NAD(P)-dependent dehydrogenase (short-subunit alcohol dehydrogenase family)
MMFGAGALLLKGRGATARRRGRLELRDKVVLITGGSRGLGLVLARELAQAGARLALCARDGAELRRALDDPELRTARRIAVPCDVGDRAEVEAAVATIESRLGPVDVLVNVAGVIGVGPDEVMEEEDYRQAMDVMFWGVLHAMRAVAPSMKRRRSGSIVNITSIGGEVPVPHLAPYTSAKFAAVGLSETLTAELAPHGIRVTTVVPGLMRTGSHLRATFKGQRRQELGWFSAGATLPLISMDARRAARRIVRALVHGEAHVTVGTPARALRLAHAVAPGLVTRLMSLVARVLPAGGARGPAREGRDVGPDIARARPFTLGARAAQRNNEL